jgi:hypothetical protein
MCWRRRGAGGWLSGDFRAVYEVLSPYAQEAVDAATRLAGGWVDVDSLIMQALAPIASWKFEEARIFSKGGSLRGTLEGTVEYTDGKPGKVHLELEQVEGTWKLRSCSLEQ